MLLINRHKKVIAYLLVVLFSLPGIGFSASVHYCNGHISGLSLIGESQSCDDEDNTKKACHVSKKKPCCSAKKNDGKGCCQDSDSYNLMDYDGTIDSYSPVDQHTHVYLSPITHTLFQTSITIYHYPNYAQPPPLSGHQLRIAFGSFIC